MRKIANSITIKTDIENSEIVIIGPDFGGGEQEIRITPEQAKLFLEWICEAEQEIRTGKS